MLALSGEDLVVYMQALKEREHAQWQRTAWCVATMRNLWASGERVTPAQLLGDEDATVKLSDDDGDLDAIDDLIEQAKLKDADGWASRALGEVIDDD